MELQAAIAAFQALREPCHVTFYTDSLYVKKGIESWLESWKSNGWRTRAKHPVKNADLWRALDKAAAPHQVDWKWLKGHAGHALNERCDQLATAEISKLRTLLTRAELDAALATFVAEQSPGADQEFLF